MNHLETLIDRVEQSRRMGGALAAESALEQVLAHELDWDSDEQSIVDPPFGSPYDFSPNRFSEARMEFLANKWSVSIGGLRHLLAITYVNISVGYRDVAAMVDETDDKVFRDMLRRRSDTAAEKAVEATGLTIHEALRLTYDAPDVLLIALLSCLGIAKTLIGKTTEGHEYLRHCLSIKPQDDESRYFQQNALDAHRAY